MSQYRFPAFTRRSFLATSLSLAAAACAPASPGQRTSEPVTKAAPVADQAAKDRAAAFFGGKSVDFMVGYNPGGGHDNEARVIARHLSRFLPGSPTIVVRNVPGAGGVVMLNQLYQAKPDGLTMGIQATSHMVAQFNREEGVAYDLKKMPLLYGVGTNSTLAVKSSTGVKTPADLVKLSQLRMPGLSYGDSRFIQNLAQVTLLGLPMERIKTIVGFAGTGEMKLAIERGDVDTISSNSIEFQEAGRPFFDMVQAGDLIPLWQGGRTGADGRVVRFPSTPDLPTIVEAYEQIHGKAPSGVEWETVRKFVIESAMSRAGLLPPALDPEREAVIKQAFDEMSKDAGFVKDWEQIMKDAWEPYSAKEAEAARDRFLDEGQFGAAVRDHVKQLTERAKASA